MIKQESMSVHDLSEILKKHKLWRNRKRGGKQADLTGVIFPRVDLTDMNLSHVILTGAILSAATLVKVNLTECKAANASFVGCDMEGAILKGADVCRAQFLYANLRKANLNLITANKATFEAACLVESNMSVGTFYGTCFRGAVLARANLTNASCANADFHLASLSNIKHNGAGFNNADFRESCGLIWADCSFAGHGERGRRILAIQRKNGVIDFHCGCFSGTTYALKRYIAGDRKDLIASRTLAMNFLINCINNTGPNYL